MAKRFIETGMFDDPWFMNLTKDGKMFWVYLITKCDHAGIMQLNEKLCKFQTGIDSIERVIKELGNRLYSIGNCVYFIPKFILFQYPNFPMSTVKQQQGAVERLCKYGLYNQETNSWSTVIEELLNSYGNDNDNDKGGMGGEIPKVLTWKNDYETYLKNCRDSFRSIESDSKFIEKFKSLFPEFHPIRTIRVCYEYWATNTGWKKKKSSKTVNIDWKATIIKGANLSKSYYTAEEKANKK